MWPSKSDSGWTCRINILTHYLMKERTPDKHGKTRKKKCVKYPVDLKESEKGEGCD